MLTNNLKIYVMRKSKYYYITTDNNTSDDFFTSCVGNWNMSLEKIIEFRLKNL